MKHDLFLFYAILYIRPQWNFDEIELSRSKYFSYYEQFSPLSYYVLVEDERIGIDVTFKFIDYDYVNNKEEDSGDNDFIIEGYVTEEIYINQHKRDINIKPYKDDSSNSKVITTDFNQQQLITKITFTSDEIKKYQATSPKYLYIVINQKKSNKKTFIKLTTQLIAIPINGIDYPLNLPSNEYYNGFLSFTTPMFFFLLSKNDITDTLIEIEYYATNNCIITINLMPDDEDISKIDYTKNNTSIIKGIKYNYGKSYIEIKMTTETKIYFSVLKTQINNNSNDLSKYTLKYQSGYRQFNHLRLRSESLTIEATIDSIKVSFEPVVNNFNKIIISNYTMNIYSMSNSTSLDMIYVDDIPDITEKITNVDKDKIMIQASTIPQNDYYITVIAEARLENNIEILLYQSRNIRIIPPDDSFPIWLIILLTILGLIILVIALFFLYFYCYFTFTRNTMSDYQAAIQITKEPLYKEDSII